MQIFQTIFSLQNLNHYIINLKFIEKNKFYKIVFFLVNSNYLLDENKFI